MVNSNLIDQSSTLYKSIIQQNTLNNVGANSELPTIFYAVDNRYAPYATVSIQSLLDNSFSKNFNIIVFSFGIEDLYMEGLLKIAKHSDVSILSVVLNQDIVEGFYESRHISKAAYLCTLVPDLIVSKTALFIDADTIMLGDVSELLRQGENIKILGACEENKDKSHHVRLGLKRESTYVNSGLLLCKTDEWKKELIHEKVKNTIQEQNKLEYHDQDLINIIFEDTLEILNWEWNKRRVGTETPYCHGDLENKQGMIHFNGIIKPWMAWAKLEDRRFYQSYAERALTNKQWYIDSPRSINEMKYLASQHENEGKLSEANLMLKKIIVIYEQALQKRSS